jgi:hypothetical protein
MEILDSYDQCEPDINIVNTIVVSKHANLLRGQQDVFLWLIKLANERAY